MFNGSLFNRIPEGESTVDVESIGCAYNDSYSLPEARIHIMGTANSSKVFDLPALPFMNLAHAPSYAVHCIQTDEALLQR